MKNPWRTLPLPLRGFLTATLAGLLLYLPLLSIQWDANGIIEAVAIERGTLITPNHLLYRPLLALFLQAAQGVGFMPPFAPLEQIFTAFFSALGLGTFFVAIYFLTRRVLPSAVATAFYATTWAYWAFSTDIYYITLAAAFASAALALVAYPARSARGIALAVLFTALTVLTWQANIFLVPALALIYFARTKAYKPAFLFAISTLALVALIYLGVSILVLHHTSLDALAKWLTSHSSDEGGRLGSWGVWSITRIRPMLVTFVAGFIPLWEGLGLSSLRQGKYSLEYLPRLLSVGALLFLPALTLLRVCQKRAPWRFAAVVVLGMLALLPFIVWWDPFEPKWFVVPNLFLLAAAAILWTQSFSARDYALVAACILVIATANFTATILPRHTRPNPNIALAACVTAQTGANDAVILTQWGWFEYARYFYNYQGETVSLIGAENTPAKIARIAQTISTATSANGHVYMRDLDTMSPPDRAAVKSLTGLDAAAFQKFNRQPAFECDGQKFVELY